MQTTSSRGFILLLVATTLATPWVAGGCASDRSRSAAPATSPAAQIALQPLGGDAALTLDEIPDKPELADASSTQPSTAPTTQRAPVESLTLYAQAVDALRTGRRF